MTLGCQIHQGGEFGGKGEGFPRGSAYALGATKGDQPRRKRTSVTRLSAAIWRPASTPDISAHIARIAEWPVAWKIHFRSILGHEKSHCNQ